MNFIKCVDIKLVVFSNFNTKQTNQKAAVFFYSEIQKMFCLSKLNENFKGHNGLFLSLLELICKKQSIVAATVEST